MKFSLLSPSLLQRSPAPDYQSLEPYPRSGHRLVASDRFVFVVGGYNPALSPSPSDPTTSSFPILKEIWVFDVYKLSWKKIEPLSGHLPEHMASHSALLYHNYIILYGGSSVPFGQANSNKLYFFNLKNLEARQVRCLQKDRLSDEVDDEDPDNDVNVPYPGYGQSAVISDEVLYIVGGTSGHVYHCDTHSLDLRKIRSLASWRLVNSPSYTLHLQRYRHECVSYKDCLILFGGGAYDEIRSLQSLDYLDLKINQWFKFETIPDPENGFPGARYCFGLSCYKDAVYLCGGRAHDHLVYDDVWKMDLDRKRWTKMSLTLPQAVFFHGFTINESGCMYLYGGVEADETTRLGKLYRFYLEPPSLKQLCAERLSYSTTTTSSSLLDSVTSDYNSIFDRCEKTEHHIFDQARCDLF